MQDKNLKIKPEISVLDISCLKPWSENPRHISQAAFTGLTKSLQRFGYVDLIVVNKRSLQIVSGHQRVKALQALGENRVKCILVDLSDQDAELLSITMNNEAICGQWSKDLISAIKTLEDSHPDDFSGLRLNSLRDSVLQLDIGDLDAQLAHLKEQVCQDEVECPRCNKKFPSDQVKK